MKETLAAAHQRLNPPKCVKNGVPPCPTCPVRSACAWADKVLLPEDARKGN